MIFSTFAKILPKALAWTGLMVFCSVVSLAQQAAPQPAATGARSDSQIEMDVVHALDSSKALKDDLITAATMQGEVTLSGTVSGAASSELAESLAGRVTGVSAVHNHLKIGNPQEAQADTSAADAQPGAQQTATDAQAEAPAPASDPASSVTDAPAATPGAPLARPRYVPQPTGPASPQYQAPPQYQAAQPPAQAYEAPHGPVTLPEGTLLQLRTNEPVGSKKAIDGTPVQFTLIQDISIGGVLALPRGATVHGVVTEVKKAGELTGSPELALKLTSLDLGGQSYPLDSDQFKVKGPSKTGQTVSNAIGGGIMGTLIGCIAGRGLGCAIGAGAGVAAGTAASAASPGPGVWIPAEAQVEFHLKAPLTVTPVSAQEASRLAQGLYPGGPTLYRRDRYYGRPYPYAYPPVYYRPYYVMGGFNYWR